jgi:hypothetical protein
MIERFLKEHLWGMRTKSQKTLVQNFVIELRSWELSAVLIHSKMNYALKKPSHWSRFPQSKNIYNQQKLYYLMFTKGAYLSIEHLEFILWDCFSIHEQFTRLNCILHELFPGKESCQIEETKRSTESVTCWMWQFLLNPVLVSCGAGSC